MTLDRQAGYELLEHAVGLDIAIVKDEVMEMEDSVASASNQRRGGRETSTFARHRRSVVRGRGAPRPVGNGVRGDGEFLRDLLLHRVRAREGTLEPTTCQRMMKTDGRCADNWWITTRNRGEAASRCDAPAGKKIRGPWPLPSGAQRRLSRVPVASRRGRTRKAGAARREARVFLVSVGCVQDHDRGRLARRLEVFFDVDHEVERHFDVSSGCRPVPDRTPSAECAGVLEDPEQRQLRRGGRSAGGCGLQVRDGSPAWSSPWRTRRASWADRLRRRLEAVDRRLTEREKQLYRNEIAKDIAY
jgi:hypothetical protein